MFQSNQPKHFAAASRTAGAIAAVGDVVWTTVYAAGQIAQAAITTGIFTLPPGHIYRLTAHLAGNTFAAITDDVEAQWVDAANAVLPGSDGGILIVPMASADVVSNKPSTQTIVDQRTATAALNVKLRITTMNGATTVFVGHCFVQQLD